jgi:hypothetical protein
MEIQLPVGVLVHVLAARQSQSACACACPLYHALYVACGCRIPTAERRSSRGLLNPSASSRARFDSPRPAKTRRLASRIRDKKKA